MYSVAVFLDVIKVCHCVKTLICLTVCRPAVMYASSVWWAPVAVPEEKPPDVSRQVIRPISQMTWFAPNETSHDTLGVLTPDSFALGFSGVRGVKVPSHRRAMQEGTGWKTKTESNGHPGRRASIETNND